MTCRIATVFALLSCALFSASLIAQPGDRCLNMRGRVLDVLFPLDVAPKPYFLKMILRFGDTDTQLAVVVYPGGKSELIRYSLMGTSGDELSQLISKMVAENPNVKEQEIAARLRVNVSRSPIEQEPFNRALKELKHIRVSPILASRVAVDEFSEYEYWYDSWQESVHYTITGPSKNTPQDQLVLWMIKFRANVSTLSKKSLSPAP